MNRSSLLAALLLLPLLAQANMKSFLDPHYWSLILLSGQIQDVQAQTDISNDTYFYGQSPPVYPSRKPLSF